MRAFGLVAKIAIPLMILAAAVYGARTIQANKPAPFSRPSPVSQQAVDAKTLVPGKYPVVIRSQGTVEPTTSNILVAEVTGTVSALSDSFVVGGEIRAGEVLVQIDERDYEIALTQAKANLAQMQAQLLEQQALAQNARDDWKSLGRRGQPSALTLREPQVAAARANLDAALASVERAELDVSRTRVVAPYSGRVLARDIAVGQFVSRGAPLGNIYSTNSVDIRLPLTSRQLTYLRLPAAQSDSAQQPNVELSASVGGQQQLWTGKLVRSEGINAETQQLNVIARVDNPFADASSPLQPGLYVEALIAGQVLDNVFVVPLSAVREEREVLVVNENSELMRRPISIAWSDESVAAVREGLQANEVLVLTPLSTVADGTPVRATIDGVAPPPLERRRANGNFGANGEGRGQGNAQGGGERRGQGNAQGGGERRGQGNAQGGGERRGQGNAQGNGERRGQGNAQGSGERRGQGNAQGNGERRATQAGQDS